MEQEHYMAQNRLTIAGRMLIYETAFESGMKVRGRCHDR